MLEIEKKKFVAAAKVLSLISPLGGVVSSENVRVTVYGKELELAVASTVRAMVRVPFVKAASFAWKEVFYVERGVLLPFILAGEDHKDNFQLAFGDLWKIKQKNRAASLYVRKEEIDGYGKWYDAVAEGMQLSDPLRKMILAANQCVTTNPSIPALQCVYLGKKSVMASNQTVVFRGKNPQSNGTICHFPANIVTLLGENAIQTVGIEKTRVVMTCDMGFLEGRVSALAQKEFPKDGLLAAIKSAKKSPLVTELPAEPFGVMLGRLAEYLQTMMDKDLTLRVQVVNGTMTLWCKVRQGTFEEKTPCKKVKDCYFEWPLQVVRPVLQYMVDNDKKIQVFAADNCPYLVSAGEVDLMIARKVKK